ncbi:MAG: hypothetical protein SOU51_00590, partial [Collinsella sp.]|nr:hypothetical protein [Collinsella sp.]
MFPLATILISAYFALPSVIPNDTGAFVFQAPFIKENRLDILSESIASGAYDSAPQNIKEANDELLSLLEKTQGSDAAVSLAAQAKIAQIDFELYESGNLSADELSLEAKRTLLDDLQALPKPVLYETTADEPMLYRLAELMGTVPPLLLLVPPIAVAYAAFRAIENDRLGFQLPLSNMGKIALAASATLVVCIVGLALALIPGALISLAKNGVGDPTYPVVLIQGGAVLESTISMTLAKALAL